MQRIDNLHWLFHLYIYEVIRYLMYSVLSSHFCKYMWYDKTFTVFHNDNKKIKNKYGLLPSINY